MAFSALALLVGSLIGPTPHPDAGTSISVSSQPAPLFGTLVRPAAKLRAVVVILPGSGPTDRNGNSPKFGISAQPYRLIAQDLAKKGIASVRIDKRGVGQSAPAALSEDQLRFNDMVTDAREWAAIASAKTGQRCAWLIGHSEGSLVALAAVKKSKKICGVISLSGAGRPAAVVIREQLASVPEPIRARAFATLAELEAGRKVDNPPPELGMLFRASVQPYMISWLALDPAQLASAYHGPLLIIQGTTDFQTSVEDARAIASKQPNAVLLLLDGVNHVLKIAPADKVKNAATYADSNLPLAPGLIEAISRFVLKRR